MEYWGNKIWTKVENVTNLGQNLATLKRKLEELNGIMEDNESKKKVALGPRKKPQRQAEIWVQNVERISGEIQNLEAEVQQSRVLSCGSLGENILKRIQEVGELIQQGKSFDRLVIDDPQWIGQVLSKTTLVGDVAKNFMEEIWGYLINDGVSKIGVWGMGGVGKTTIMKLINNQLLKETGKFEAVIWITVSKAISKEMSIANIQKGIARAMNVSLSNDDDETMRAGKICEKLAGKGKYVIILDDLWQKFSLEEVGIPEPSNGSKLVITTRSSDVCRYFGSRVVKLSPLPKQDAWSLFSEKVGQDVLNCPDLLPIVKSVAKECAGLPLAIVSIASSMKGVCDVHEWRNALNELSRCVASVNEFDEPVFRRLQFSYDRLGNEKVKYCFLYCALYPEDYKIRKDGLLQRWIEEGFVEEMDSMQEVIDKGHAIMNKLINNCLLEECRSSYEYVQMHDLMRDMALRITSVRPRFLVRASMQLQEMPDIQEWNEDLEKVSLMGNWQLEIPAQLPPPKCQKLTTLLLSRCFISSIPECFFEHMRGLKILDLSKNPFITSLPNSISNLETLTVLLLAWCTELEKVPSFSKLQALKKLDLRGTGIKDLPHGMERLVNLKYLDLRETTITEVADGTLVNFKCLQHLATDRFLKGEEIGGLRNLEYFQGRFDNLKDYTIYAQALLAQTKLPTEYNIFVSDEEKVHLVMGSPQIQHGLYKEKAVVLDSCKICRNGIKLLSDVERLEIVKCIFEFCEEEAFFSWFIPMSYDTFSSLYVIEIRKCKNIKKLFSSTSVLQNLHNLVRLCVEDCEEMEEIVASASQSESVEEGIGAIKFTLPKLEILELYDLPELKSICSANGVMVCDSLISIAIKNCPKLRRIPLYLPLGDDGQPSLPPSLREIGVYPEEWWESLELDHPNAKSRAKSRAKSLQAEQISSSTVLSQLRILHSQAQYFLSK